MAESSEWNLCVINHLPRFPGNAELANALLYGDRVVWLPTELFNLVPARFTTTAGRKVELSIGLRSLPAHAGMTEEDLTRRRTAYSELIQQIEAAGFHVEIPVTFVPQKLLEFAAARVLGLTPTTAWTPLGSAAFIEPPYMEELVRKVFGSRQTFDLITIARLAWELDERIPAEVRHYLDANDIQGCIVEPRSPYALEPLAAWDAHGAAQLLMDALSRLLLPDVSRLPLSVVAELKAHVKDHLDPMRADMLRLTKQLRALAGEERSREALAREAANVIATEVEPVVRESARYTADVVKSRWKKLLRGTAQFIGVAGLGFLNPAMFAKEAAMRGVEVVGDASEAVGAVRPPGAAARFVLEVKRRLKS